jgi:hypothetical protein
VWWDAIAGSLCSVWDAGACDADLTQRWWLFHRCSRRLGGSRCSHQVAAALRGDVAVPADIPSPPRGEALAALHAFCVRARLLRGGGGDGVRKGFLGVGLSRHAVAGG